jgi:F420H(2)-dependent quinone reductase
MVVSSLDPLTFERANVIQKALRRVAGSGPGSWLFARVLHRIDPPVYRLTRGRHTFASLLSGIPVVMLTTVGARSGQPRTVPVLGLPTTEGLAVIASNFGQTPAPGLVLQPSRQSRRLGRCRWPLTTLPRR